MTSHVIEASSDLEMLRQHLGDCQRCSLGATRTTLVFGVGGSSARLMLIGEAPGRNEDLRGEPFVGAAGRFLDQLLGSIGLVRSQVYIANVLKCRPPGNRDPLPAEVITCTPFLDEQIRLVDPCVVATLGNHATRHVLSTREGITGIHGRLFVSRGRRVVPIFHPAAALYDGSKRSALFDDFRRLQRVIEAVGRGEEWTNPGAGAGPREDADGGCGLEIEIPERPAATLGSPVVEQVALEGLEK